MGHEKDLAIKEEEQGWSLAPGIRVCHWCMSDPELAEYVQSNATDFECDFCDRLGKKKPISIAFDSLMDLINKVVDQYYERAVDVMGWDSAEGGYLGTTYNSHEIVRNSLDPISENERVV